MAPYQIFSNRKDGDLSLALSDAGKTVAGAAGIAAEAGAAVVSATGVAGVGGMVAIGTALVGTGLAPASATALAIGEVAKYPNRAS